MSATVPLLLASNGRALWYLTRSTGIVALLLLTATVVVGVVASVGWTTERWPRFLSQGVHRNLSLFCVGFVALHVITTVSDGYVPIGFADAFIPFASPYRPLWVGLGALAFDLLLVVLATSALRHRIGYASWRFVHWLAYLCWPIAMFHTAGSGSDASLPFMLALDALCGTAVLTVVAWRLISGREIPIGRRAAAAVGAVVVTGALALFVALGPLRPGWSHRAGTSTALLAQLARTSAAASSSAPTQGTVGPSDTGQPTVPFTYDVTGTQSVTTPGANGQVVVTIDLRVQDPSSTALSVVLDGTALPAGGISLASGTVDFGGTHGVVTGLDGGSVTASLPTSPPEKLALQLATSGGSDHLSGTVTGTSDGTGGGQG